MIAAKAGDDSTFANYKVLIPLFAWGLGFPLAMLPNIELFSVPSTGSQIGIFYAAALIAYYGAWPRTLPGLRCAPPRRRRYRRL